jgi:hypothetical protein
VALAPGVGDEQVGQPVAVIVGSRDPHPGVVVGDAFVLGLVPQAETEACRVGGGTSGPGLVAVEAVGVLVVGHVDVEAAVAVEVQHDGAEAVLRLAGIEPGGLAHLAEARPPVRAGSQVR